MRTRSFAIFLLAATAIMAGCGSDSSSRSDATAIVNIFPPGNGNGNGGGNSTIQFQERGGSVTCSQNPITLHANGQGFYYATGALSASQEPGGMSTKVSAPANSQGSGWVYAIPQSGGTRDSVQVSYNTMNCGGGGIPDIVARIDYIPPGGSYNIGVPVQLTKQCFNWSNNQIICPTTGFVWSVSVPTIGTVTQDGVFTCINPGDVEVILTYQGMQARHTFHCNGPTAQQLRVTVTPGTWQLVNGVCQMTLTFSATYGGNAVTGVSYSYNGQAVSGTTLTVNTGGSYSASGTYQGQTATTTGNLSAPSCQTPTQQCTAPSTVDYTPGDQTVVVGQVVQLTVSNWTNYSCMPYWYVKTPTIGLVNGGDAIYWVQGVPFYAGVHATFIARNPGDVEVCVQVALTNPVVMRCHVKHVVAASGNTTGEFAGRFNSDLSFDQLKALNQQLKYHDLDWVSATKPDYIK